MYLFDSIGISIKYHQTDKVSLTSTRKTLEAHQHELPSNEMI